MKRITAASLFCLLATAASAQQPARIDAATADRYFNSTFGKAAGEWKARTMQDDAQRTCSELRNELPQADFVKLLEKEKAKVVFPVDGNVVGDWKKGRDIASRGSGGQFSDTPETFRGGNCYACHQLSPAEVSFGTLGPRLTGYGRTRKFDKAEATLAFAKIYNAQSVLPCSNMPRFGVSGFLTLEQIKDAVAYLFDPESPVNK